MNYVGNQPVPPGFVLIGDTNAVGAIIWSHKVPDGSYLQLNGQIVSKVTYADLWAYAQSFLTADQTTNPGLYRSVDANTFALPIFDGLFIRAAGQVDASHVAAALGVKQADLFLSHNHPGSVTSNSYQSVGAGGPAYGSTAVGEQGLNGVSIAAQGGVETRPVNIALVPCVKALRTLIMQSPGVLASQADMEAAVASDRLVTPSVLKFSPGELKAAVTFAGVGAATIRASMNVASVVRNGAGDYTINFTTPFSSAFYFWQFATDSGGARIIGPLAEANILAGSIRFSSRQTTDAAPATDANVVSACFWGDQ